MKKQIKRILCAACAFATLFALSCGDNDAGNSNSIGGSDSISGSESSVGKQEKVKITFKDEDDEILSIKSVEKGGTLTSFPNLGARKEMFGYEVSWVDVDGGEVSFENVTQDMTVYLQITKINYCVQYADSPLVIDGEIDETWENAITFHCNNKNVDNGGDENLVDIGYVKVMWREEGLYFLGVVTDDTVVADDCCTFWVAETATDVADTPYSYNPDDGRYAAIITPDATEKTYNNIPKLTDLPNVQVASRKTGNGYTIELYVPCLSKSSFTEGDYIGFDVSIDGYETVGGERYGYSNWYGVGYYWSDVSALYKLQLKKD